MKVLLDTNVVLDVLLARQPFAAASNAVFLRVEDGEWQGFLGATTLTTVDYLLSQSVGRVQGRLHIEQLLAVFEVAAINKKVLQTAVQSKLKDFEDAVLAEAARECKVDCIITRNARDFVGCGVNVATPAQILADM